MKNLFTFFKHAKEFGLKKLILALLMASFAVGAAGAEETSGTLKNALMLDSATLFKGIIASDSDEDMSFFCIAAAYERQVASHFSIGAELDLYIGEVWNVDYLYFGMAAAGRFYPMSETMEKFFMGANLGFNRQSVDGKADPEDGGFSGLTFGLRSGYKLFFTGRFFIEPSMAYIYAKSSDFFSGIPTPLGWQAGLRAGFAF